MSRWGALSPVLSTLPLSPLCLLQEREVCQETNSDRSLIDPDDTCLGGSIQAHTRTMKQAEEQ